MDAAENIPANTSSSPAYLSREELAAATGLSLATIARYRAAGRLPFSQPAGKRGRVLFPREILSTLTSVGVAPQSSISAQRPTLAGPKPKWLMRAKINKGTINENK